MRKVYGLSSALKSIKSKSKSKSLQKSTRKDPKILLNSKFKQNQQKPNITTVKNHKPIQSNILIETQPLVESKLIDDKSVIDLQEKSPNNIKNKINSSEMYFSSPKNNKTSQKPIQKKMTIASRLQENYKPIQQSIAIESKNLLAGSVSETKLNIRPQSKMINSMKSELIKKNNSNIRTFARFRPLSSMQKQLSENGIGSLICNFVSQNQVLIKSGTEVGFNLDKIYKPEQTQQKIYYDVGREVISQIFNGYNGTLFAYGQTGSGKTYTMYGNLNDETNTGIIPRAVKDIFQHIEYDQQPEKKYIITCSILELYKQTLYDLIVGGKNNLKIKQSPVKGIYVEGLEQFHVSSETDLMEIILKANQNKSVRSTKMNQYSSRSHTILMLQVTQQLNNGAQKKGKLNLVDLAGSQKVSKSGSVGQSLQEAKKINLSLSCLGNVIHALTNHNEHIPYRDSKLTRLLQESLGGNYKTYLIATCSMHSSNIEQSISTLKFATRVKSIKNNFKVNVVSSNISLRIIIGMQKKQIQQLKNELSRIYKLCQKLKNEISGYKICPPSMNYLLNEIQQSYNQFEKNSAKNKLNELFQNQKFMKSYGIRDLQELNSIKKEIQQTYLFEENFKNSSQNKDSDQISVGSLSQPKNLKDQSNFRMMLEQKQLKIKQLQKQVVELKKTSIMQQKKLITYQQQKSLMQNKYQKQLNKTQYGNFQIEVLQKQIDALVGKICKNQKSIQELLIEKQNLINKKFEQYMNKKLEFTEIKLGQYFKNSLNFNFEKQIQVAKNNKTSFIGALDFKKFTNNENDIYKKNVSLDAKIQNLQSIFSGKQYSKDAIIYALKKDLINSQIINQHLVRTLSALEWKQVIEYGKAKLKTTMNNIQSNTIQQLQKVLAESSESHRMLRNKIQKLQFDYNYGQNQSISKKPKIIVPINNHKKQDKSIINISKNQTTINLQSVIPQFKEIKLKVIEISREIMPITYENVISILKQRNKFILNIWQNLNKQTLITLLKKGSKICENEKIMKQLKKQNERLASKVNSLQSELQIEVAKCDQFKSAYLVSQQNIQKLKNLSEELQISLRNNLKEQNESWQKTVKNLREMHQKQIERRALQQTNKLLESRKMDSRGITLTENQRKN